MKVVLQKTSLRLLLKWAQRTLLTSGILTLGYCGFVLVDAWMFQKRESRHLELLLEEQHVAERQRPAQVVTPPESSPVIGPDGLIGRIEIPRLGLSVVLLEGTANATLRRAVGHPVPKKQQSSGLTPGCTTLIEGTALPGQRGNVGLAGHRDTFFRPLRSIQENDIITLTTIRSEYRYRVVSTRIVNPEDIEVLDSDGTEILTLVTCYPFYFVGAAPNRFIVRAERVS